MRRNGISARSGQKIVQSRHDLCALTHRRGDTFDRARADVTNCEHALHTGFQRPAAASQHKTFRIESNTGTFQPVGVRIRASEEK